MGFKLESSHIDSYHRNGFAIFRKLVPATLLTQMRRETDKAREIARKVHGAQSQRLQPIANYEVDYTPFREFGQLAPLQDALHQLLGPSHTFPNENLLGVLIEPAELPWCTAWHRDWRDNMAGLELARWDAVLTDINLFNQVNCALYEDSSTWIVPGSHLRRDLPEEAARFPDRPISGPQLDGLNTEARELACLEYCQSMPGALQVLLNPGDFMLYRNSLWHIGNYVPYRKRATLHDAVNTPEFDVWRDRVMQEIPKRKAAGLLWENPNAPSRAAAPAAG